jgi:DNA-binding GntR family transcriptional regulator
MLVDLVAAGDGARVETALIRHIGHVRGIWATGQE